MNGSLTGDFNRTGEGGIMTAVGREGGPGVSTTINLGHTHRDRN
jgi:hypothetical protein